MKKVIALFESARTVIKGERICKSNSIYCKVIPVPRHISSECGMALDVMAEDTATIERLLKDSMIAVRFESIEL